MIKGTVLPKSDHSLLLPSDLVQGLPWGPPTVEMTPSVLASFLFLVSFMTQLFIHSFLNIFIKQTFNK